MHYNEENEVSVTMSETMSGRCVSFRPLCLIHASVHSFHYIIIKQQGERDTSQQPGTELA